MLGPIATSRTGEPLLHSALGATFHLEALRPDDAPRLALACAQIHAWMGASLRFTWSSVHTSVEAFSPGDLDLVASYPAQLRDTEVHANPRAQAGASALAAAHYDRFGVACHGGERRNVASPYSFRFYAVARPPVADAIFETRAMIALTVPETVPHEEFREKVTGIAAGLRIRWGAAGLAYGAWEHDRYGDTRDAIYAHARRFVGYDHGQHATLMDAWHDRVRTVSWLTFLGPAFVDRLKKAGETLASDDLVTVAPAGEAIVLRAGERPQAGDVNRLRAPAAYVRADARIRAVRAASDLHFCAPWSAATTEAWLRRFEIAGRA